jgi:hypothetical protein
MRRMRGAHPYPQAGGGDLRRDRHLQQDQRVRPLLSQWQEDHQVGSFKLS